ncbi:MAG: cation diffusion facilitator family transporter [Rothia sp. (in: high G+C Gram-positive bacteria)]|uniref:cation diffusion facilitator family transporter n=1 Tax=Rothia sp. (in: high G+C Gram-positive bacteria) TaxID=1885016 RepID=UPI0027095766|nr:cation diffusion facilitator family transporter [Rothia sp. (in: high G+C Gram-positive bacteria)]
MGHSHGHSHSHTHGHSQGAGVNERRLIVVVAIAWSLVAFQLVGAWLTGSLALLFDTVHVFTDALGVSVALAAARLVRLPASSRHTWGFRRVEVLSAMFQAAVLLGVGLFVLYEAVQRLLEPAPIPGREVLIFGVIGLVGNIVMIAVLLGGERTNFNMRAAFLEVLNDALGSVAVVISALVIWRTGFYQADALVAMLIGLLIIPRTVKLFRETASVLLESTPRGLNLDEVRRHLESQPHVVAVHDLHASQISSDLPVLTAHIVLDDECFTSGHSVEILKHLQSCVAEHFEVSIKHSTFQMEPRSLAADEDLRNLH